jgi:hypothetical protein
MNPQGLTLLAQLRRIGQSPELAVIVTDDWRYITLAEDIGALAIYAKPEHHTCDWSPLAGLDVIYIPRDGDTHGNCRLAKALWDAKPYRVQSLLDGVLCNLWFSRAEAA